MKIKELVIIGIAAGGAYFLLMQGMSLPNIRKTLTKSWDEAFSDDKERKKAGQRKREGKQHGRKRSKKID